MPPPPISPPTSASGTFAVPLDDGTLRRSLWLWGALLTLLGGAGLLWHLSHPYREAAAFLERVERGAAAGACCATSAEERSLVVQTPGGAVRVRAFTPADVDSSPGVVLVHGVHRLGADDARVLAFAHELSRTGFVVWVPQLEELASYRLEPSVVVKVQQVAKALAEEMSAARVGVVGISFGGGLALSAAADRADGGAIGWVLSIGGYGDFERVARFHLGEQARGPDDEEAPAAHPYGRHVLAWRYAAALFRDVDVPRVRRALRYRLDDDSAGLEGWLRGLPPGERAEVQRVLSRLEDPSLLRSFDELLVRERPTLAALSAAGRLEALGRVPVFLVHGSTDSVIPATQSLWLARELPEGARQGVLIAPWLEHVRARAVPTWQQQLEATRLFARVFATARSLR